MEDLRAYVGPDRTVAWGIVAQPPEGRAAVDPVLIAPAMQARYLYSDLWTALESLEAMRADIVSMRNIEQIYGTRAARSICVLPWACRPATESQRAAGYSWGDPVQHPGAIH
jgi:hypothetical protein